MGAEEGTVASVVSAEVLDATECGPRFHGPGKARVSHLFLADERLQERPDLARSSSNSQRKFRSTGETQGHEASVFVYRHHLPKVGLLPADFLAELLAPKTAIEGLAPVSYNLAESERISEQVNRSWNRLKGRWTDFKKAIADKQPGESTTTETRDRWLHPIFQELGFGQKLPTARAVEIDGRSYPVSHGWSHVPIHLVGSHVDIDRRTPGAVGAAKASPHSLVQQVLNASTGHLWGIVSNGLTFRLLRDSVALTRLSYVEWDLAAIFDGDLYSEFLRPLARWPHQSRFDAERAELCWLERWKKSAENKGFQALEKTLPRRQDSDCGTRRRPRLAPGKHRAPR